LDDPFGLPSGEDDQDLEAGDLRRDLPSRHRRWLAALSIGLQAAALWLRRACRFPLQAALAGGLIATLIAWVSSPLAVTVAGLLSLAWLFNPMN